MCARNISSINSGRTFKRQWCCYCWEFTLFLLCHHRPFFLFSDSSITQPLLEMNQWFGRLKVWENRFCSPFSKSNLLSPPHSVTTHTSSYTIKGTLVIFKPKKCNSKFIILSESCEFGLLYYCLFSRVTWYFNFTKKLVNFLIQYWPLCRMRSVTKDHWVKVVLIMIHFCMLNENFSHS